MRSIGIALVLSMNLGGGFGTASAEIVSYADEGMVVRLRVEVEVSTSSVVAHLQAPGETELTIPMLAKGGGLYEIQTDLPAIDYQVVFEAIGSTGAISSSNSLSALGAEFPEGVDTTTPEDDEESDASGWGWLALALGAASLSALAFWVLGGSDDEDESPADDGEESEGDDEIDDGQPEAGEAD
jgi:hypothetical protein